MYGGTDLIVMILPKQKKVMVQQPILDGTSSEMLVRIQWSGITMNYQILVIDSYIYLSRNYKVDGREVMYCFRITHTTQWHAVIQLFGTNYFMTWSH